MRNFFIRSLLVLLAGVALSAPAALAQDALKVSDSEAVATAFYKTAGTPPNFERWVRETEPYRTTPLARRPEVLEAEILRRKLAYEDFDPQKNFIVVKAMARAGLSPKAPEPAAEGTVEEGPPAYNLSVVFEDGDVEFFPYEFAGDRFAVVPQELDRSLEAEIGQEQYEYIREALGTNGRALMLLQLRPVQADLSAPHPLKGTEHWVLTADIAAVSLWDHQGRLVWERTAGWFISPTTHSLMQLYQDPESRDQAPE